MKTRAKAVDPGVLDSACRRVRQELGCSDERAFDLLYGWAASEHRQLYTVAYDVANGGNIRRRLGPQLPKI